jgi:NAD(P)-dependent dehydrogenase (short-subunit alcohol dehydrogenase family)
MDDKICLVTGATSGLGLATARGLAGLGATVVLVGRTYERAAAAAQLVRQAEPEARVEWLAADFLSQQEVRNLAAAFMARHRRLDVLVNNAGAIFPRRRRTPEGIELTLAVNHLAPFLLTNLLLDVLRAGAPARIVTVSSVAHERAGADFEALDAEGPFLPFRAYARSKLANLLFTYELAQRLEGSGVTANAVNPGLVRTGLGRGNGSVRDLAWHLTHLRHRAVLLTPEQGADTIIFLASAPDVAASNGMYFSERRPAASSAASHDAAAARRLWSLSERACGETVSALARPIPATS